MHKQPPLNSQKPAQTLPAEKSQAIGLLIRLTNNLVTLAEREARALAHNDMLAFAILQDEKSLVTEHYMKASEEFRSRLEDFRGTDKNLLDRLEQLQKLLSEKTSNNNHVVTQIYDRAQSKTQSALVTAQELGQNRVTMAANTSQQAGA